MARLYVYILLFDFHSYQTGPDPAKCSEPSEEYKSATDKREERAVYSALSLQICNLRIR